MMKYPLEQCIGSRLRVLSRRVDNIYRKHLGESGVTENQLSIMMALMVTGKIEQKGISDLLNLEKSSLSRNLIRLVSADYILKSGAVNRPMIELTSRGSDKVNELKPKWELAMNEIHQVMNESDVEAFNQVEQQLSKL